MTVIEQLQADLAAAKAEVARIEGQIAMIPSEFHTLETELWAKIKNWFGVADAAPTPAPVNPTAPPTA